MPMPPRSSTRRAPPIGCACPIPWTGACPPARIRRPAPSIYYYFKTAPKDEVKLEILDTQGSVVKTYSSIKKEEDAGPAEWPDVQHLSETLPVEAGLNRFSWNLRYEDPVKVPGNFYETDIPPKGPMALPGAYQVRLTVAGQSQTAPLELRQDPRIVISTDRSGKAIRPGAADSPPPHRAAQHRQRHSRPARAVERPGAAL